MKQKIESMTLWNLKIYRSNYNKAKSYQILKKFLLLFIFHAFKPIFLSFYTSSINKISIDNFSSLTFQAFLSIP